MRISRVFAIALLCFFFSLQCLSQVHVPPPPSGGITVEDIISLSNSGVSAETIVGQIRMRGTPLSPTPSQLLQMHDAGVSNAVIQEPSAAPNRQPPLPALRRLHLLLHRYRLARRPIARNRQSMRPPPPLRSFSVSGWPAAIPIEC